MSDPLETIIASIAASIADGYGLPEQEVGALQARIAKRLEFHMRLPFSDEVPETGPWTGYR